MPYGPLGSRKVHGGKRHTPEVDWDEADLLHAIGIHTFDARDILGHLSAGAGAAFAQVDVDTADRGGLLAAQRTGQLAEGVVVKRAVLDGVGDVQPDVATGLQHGGVNGVAVFIPGGDVALLKRRRVLSLWRRGLEYWRSGRGSSSRKTLERLEHALRNEVHQQAQVLE
ncbi:hypothetical protein SAMN04490185_2540 [Pseudomonas frederiksbergensis]|uniref:Uncharacterized protein n=1 Tax=Pseudomonas frederiksbergensis TaxID=104087 RepID=A0A1H4X403_9PSED|nr:hypothetical protein [Pseudomonas frederiksbergensis]SED00287.1 hypothetical protein SAMN04490185_2540 [Pseudomonas frederiksbergensis]